MGDYKKDKEVIGEKPCKCGCGNNIKIRKWHMHPSKSIPDFIKGHQQYGNKRGWKGGEVKDVHGYILVYSPDHPNRNAQGAGYVKRSRLVMEKELGRYLKKNEVVHHRNGIRDDDRIENLVLMTNRTHLSLHHKELVKNANRDERGRFTKGGGA